MTEVKVRLKPCPVCGKVREATMTLHEWQEYQKLLWLSRDKESTLLGIKRTVMCDKCKKRI